MAQKIKIENGTNFNCFVPSCSNKKIIDGMPLHFFQVPLGYEGLRWKEAVKSTQPQYEKTIGILRRRISASVLYCCEVHFNIETDCVTTIDENGLVEIKIKPGVVPSIKPKRTKQLCEIREKDNSDNTLQEIDWDMDDDFLQTIKTRSDPEVVNHKRDFISIVDMLTLICKHFHDKTLSSQEHNDQTNLFDHHIEIKHEPMMPLTVDLMRRKSFYYMGLEQNDFFRLLQIIRNSTDMTDTLTEMKIMLTLRKHRLNEEFEALGDLFDIDKTTAQQYDDESKNLVSDIYHSVINSIPNPTLEASSLLEIKSNLGTQNHFESYDDDNVTKHEHEQEDNSSESEQSVKIKYKPTNTNKQNKYKYKGYHDSEFDSDVDSDDLDESDSDVNSDDLDYSDVDFDNLSTDSDASLVRGETFDCQICKKSVRRLDHHMEVTHLNPQYLNKTICGLCLEKFENNTKLRAHQTDFHHGNACACDLCGKMFSKYSSMKEHILKVHLKLKPFLCHTCGTSHQTSSRLRVHMETAHLKIRKHVCHLCDKKYFQLYTLNAHIRSVHTKEKPFKCEFKDCGKFFCRSASLYTHQQMHKAKFKCEICAKTFSFKHNLLTHSKNIHGKNIIDLEKCKIELS